MQHTSLQDRTSQQDGKPGLANLGGSALLVALAAIAAATSAPSMAAAPEQPGQAMDSRAAVLEATTQGPQATAATQTQVQTPARTQPQPERVAVDFGPAADLGKLEQSRGGTDVHSEMKLDGVVSGNSAINVITGGNTIDAGAFANMSGIPVVIQNSGANVLIQNATIVNLQFK